MIHVLMLRLHAVTSLVIRKGRTGRWVGVSCRVTAHSCTGISSLGTGSTIPTIFSINGLGNIVRSLEQVESSLTSVVHGVLDLSVVVENILSVVDLENLTKMELQR